MDSGRAEAGLVEGLKEGSGEKLQLGCKMMIMIMTIIKK